jgi:AraC family transcriptional regulator
VTIPAGRDRLRELLDAVLADEHGSLGEMARGAHASPFHFSRELSRGTGEPPVTMRRRVMLERAAWQLARGSSVTDAAFAAGYDSVDGFARAFSRAYGHPPSDTSATGDHWLPSPNGIHFHPPMSLWVDAAAERTPRAGGAGEVTAMLVEHDLDDVRALLRAAGPLEDAELRRERLPGHLVQPWDGTEVDLLSVLHHLVTTVEVWWAAIAGQDAPPSTPDDDVAALMLRHERIAPRWLATVREIDRRDGWRDRVVDALCDPPESFVLGAVLAHVLTSSIARRHVARHLLRQAGALPLPRDPKDNPADPIIWLQTREEAPE